MQHRRGARKTGRPQAEQTPRTERLPGILAELPGKCSAALCKLQPRPASDRKAMAADWKVTGDDRDAEKPKLSYSFLPKPFSKGREDKQSFL